eukprot:CAMPEP_0113557254 /NCGR_PEP_ID=MMETSP0015_2-20120614/17690_1 /TAXON_ID=2838 /ORGANISM="Odontella" /LENGTH=429 /DNA_ID=CAMNT_0000458661 /DNA_START=82 /DNA_END=1371 /DNA_ORIENTATION=+ /assembly_acc=CAM_ASM_000160
MKPIFGALLTLLAFDLPGLDALPSPKSGIPSAEQAEPSSVEELGDAFLEPPAADFGSASRGHGRDLSFVSLPQWNPGDNLVTGQLIQFNGDFYRVQQNHTAAAEWDPSITHALFALEPIDMDWVAGSWYYLGYVVDYNGNKYRCIHSHQAASGWQPDVTPSLWVMDNAITDLELNSRGSVAVIVDTADAVLDAFNQIVAQVGDPLTDTDLSAFEIELYNAVPDLQAFICAMNGRVPLSQTELDATVARIEANPAMIILESLAVAGTSTTAGDVRALLVNNPFLETVLTGEFLSEISGLNDNEVVILNGTRGWWDLAFDDDGTAPFPDYTPARNLLRGRMLGFWNTLKNIGKAIVGVATVAVGVIKTIACGICGIPAIVSGASIFTTALVGFGVNVPFITGTGLTVKCITISNVKSCAIVPSGIRLGGVD